MESTNKQHELYENARSRVKQKKRLYYHFILFLVGSLLFYIANKLLHIREDIIENWYLWAIFLWLIFLILHIIDVFITKKFMGKDWERQQTEKLVDKQERKIEKIGKKLEREAELEAESKAYEAELKKEKLQSDSTDTK